MSLVPLLGYGVVRDFEGAGYTFSFLPWGSKDAIDLRFVECDGKKREGKDGGRKR